MNAMSQALEEIIPAEAVTEIIPPQATNESNPAQKSKVKKSVERSAEKSALKGCRRALTMLKKKEVTLTERIAKVETALRSVAEEKKAFLKQTLAGMTKELNTILRKKKEREGVIGAATEMAAENERLLNRILS